MGEKRYVWQTCYGPAISRIYASVISILGDDHGLRFPFALAPIQVIIVPIYTDENKDKIIKYCNKIKKTLKNYRVEIDLSDNTPGFKFNEWEMKGVPLRLEIGQKEVDSNTITIAVRTTKGKDNISLKDIKKTVKNKGKVITNYLKQEADKNFEDIIHDAKTMDELKTVLGTGGFARVPFCSINKNGKDCADNLKAETTGDVRGTRFDKNEKPDAGAKCIFCGKPAKHIVYVAKQY